MALIRQNVNLKTLNTFAISANARYYTELESLEDFEDVRISEVYQKFPKLIIGGGSNILFTQDFEGLVIRNRMKGVVVLEENDERAVVKVAAGENWHEFVMWSINKGFAGIENLSLIPGCVGASPMQNIGAYGVEIKEVFHSLEAIDMSSGALRVFTKEDCHFGYRESVFKNIFKNQFLITSVSFNLSRKPLLNTSYGAIGTELTAMGITHPDARDVSQAVMNIRRSKLPDPAVTGNAGSFFKNPEVDAAVQAKLKLQFPDLVSYELSDGRFKLAAGWLIEHCGLKGFSVNGAAVHTKQALVLINTGTATGADVLALSVEVIRQVKDKYGVTLEREVNII